MIQNERETRNEEKTTAGKSSLSTSKIQTIITSKTTGKQSTDSPTVKLMSTKMLTTAVSPSTTFQSSTPTSIQALGNENNV